MQLQLHFNNIYLISVGLPSDPNITKKIFIQFLILKVDIHKPWIIFIEFSSLTFAIIIGILSVFSSKCIIKNSPAFVCFGLFGAN